MRCLKKSFSIFILLISFITPKAQLALTDSLFHPDSLRNIVKVLASDSLQGRLSGTDEGLKAAFFISEEFRKTGLQPVAGNEGFLQQVRPSWYNVVGAIQGRTRPGELIIFSAHYDHIGSRSNNHDIKKMRAGKNQKDDGIYNGANDNASGVSAVISLAKYFKALDNNERTLIFVAFTGEEFGLIGSLFMAENCEADSIVALINIEMIGRGGLLSSYPFVTGDGKSNLIKILNRNYRSLANNDSEEDFFRTDHFQNEFFFMRSDNYPFALKRVPAHTIMVTPPGDDFYHRPDDEAETLDYGLMKKVIRAIAYGTAGLVKGTDTPYRIFKPN